MIVTLAIWSYITFIAMTLGCGICYVIRRVTGYRNSDIGLSWVLGLCTVTVYSEYYSLFEGVGRNANIVIAIICIFIFLLRKRQAVYWFRQKIQFIYREKKWRELLFFAFFLLFFLLVSCQRAIHADTDLYHAQAIRWIEEYGVVKGLGNLHNRLAYNSAFMCLQALFSGAFLLNQSTHVVNGYIAFGMFVYAFGGLFGFQKSFQKIRSADLFRIVMLIYVCEPRSLSILSSPNTDTFSLLLILFILIKWCDLLEGNEKESIPFGILCVIGLFSISVKLSTIMILLLVCKPAVILVKEKKWKEILFFICWGLVIISPFLIRNFMISGYLVYPYSSIDLFDVDWKMARSVVDFDRKEIMAYGRGLGSYEYSQYTLSQWIPIWWERQSLWLKGMIIVNVLLMILCVILFIKEIKQRNIHFDRVLLLITEAVCLLFWFMSAPLPRYGIVYVFGIPCVLIGNYGGKWFGKIGTYFMFAVVLGCSLSLIREVVKGIEEVSFRRPSYYIFRECEEQEWNGISMYVAEENRYCGYYYFPALPYEKTLNFIELRGVTINEGFKVKDDVKDIVFNNSGEVYQ